MNDALRRALKQLRLSGLLERPGGAAAGGGRATA